MSAPDEVVVAVQALAERLAGAARIPPRADRQTRLSEGYWLDSLELFRLVLACEQTFGIAFDGPHDLEPATFETLGTLSDLIGEKLAALRNGS